MNESNPMESSSFEIQCETNRLRGLLLDFGSVISVSVFERHRTTERILGLEAGTLRWLGPIDPATDELWAAMQRGEISEREYWRLRARDLGELVERAAWGVTEMLHRIRQSDPDDVIRPEMRSLIRGAKRQGIRVGILSNELELFYGKEFLARMDVVQEMDCIVDATHTHILKPDPRAYQQALEGLCLPPSQVLFVDDQLRNIAGAVAVGLQTHHFDLRDVAGNIDAIAARLHVIK